MTGVSYQLGLTWWRTVGVEESSSEQVAISRVVGHVGRPDHLHRLGVHSLVLVVIVQPAEEETVEAHMSEYVCLLSAVSERINLPGHSRPPTQPEVVRKKSDGKSLPV